MGPPADGHARTPTSRAGPDPQGRGEPCPLRIALVPLSDTSTASETRLRRSCTGRRSRAASCVTRSHTSGSRWIDAARFFGLLFMRRSVPRAAGSATHGEREQALAALFYRSGWTQEELAKKEGKSQQWLAEW